MHKKKLFRITTVPKSFGLLKYQLQFLNNQFDVTAVSSPGSELVEVAAREGVKTISLSMERKISILKDIISLVRMWKLFMEERPYIIHSHTDKAGLIAMIAGKLAGVPHRIHTYAGLIFPTSVGIKKYVLWSTDWITCFCATIAIPEGKGVKNDLIRSGINFRKLELVANGSLCGIDLSYYSKTAFLLAEAQKLRVKLGIDNDEVVYSFVGRIVKDKGIEELVHAFLKLVEKDKIQAHLLIAGDFDDNLYPVDSFIHENIINHPAIHWLGFMKDVRPVFVASDVFVLPSYREGFPNVVLQSCALEVATIVTDINGSNEIIQNEVNGLVVPSKNADRLLGAMNELYFSSQKRMEFGSSGAKLVSERYNRQLIWDGLMDLYSSLK